MGKGGYRLAIGDVGIDAGGAWCERSVEGGSEGGDGAVGAPGEGLLVGIEDVDKEEGEGNGKD